MKEQRELKEQTRISANLRENEKYLRTRLENCSDILIRPMRLGENHKVDCLMVYIEVAVSNMMLDDSAIGKMINHFWEISPDQIQDFVQNNSLGIADVKKLADLDEAAHEGSDAPCEKQSPVLQTGAFSHSFLCLSSRSILPDYPDNRHYCFRSGNYRAHLHRRSSERPDQAVP